MNHKTLKLKDLQDSLKIVYDFELQILNHINKSDNQLVTTKSFHVVWQIENSTANSKNNNEKMKIRTHMELLNVQKTAIFAVKSSSVSIIAQWFDGSQTVYDCLGLDIGMALNPLEHTKNIQTQVTLQSTKLHIHARLKSKFIEAMTIMPQVRMSKGFANQCGYSCFSSYHPENDNKPIKRQEKQQQFFFPNNKFSLQEMSCVKSFSSSACVVGQQNPEQALLSYYKRKVDQLKEKNEDLQLQLLEFNRLKERHEKLLKQRAQFEKTAIPRNIHNHICDQSSQIMKLKKNNTQLWSQVRQLSKENSILNKKNEVVLTELMNVRERQKQGIARDNQSETVKETLLENELRKSRNKIEKLQKQLSQLQNQNISMSIQIMKYRTGWKMQTSKQNTCTSKEMKLLGRAKGYLDTGYIHFD